MMSDSTFRASDLGWKEAPHGISRFQLLPEALHVVARGEDRVLILIRNGIEVETLTLGAAEAARIAALLMPASPPEAA